VVDRGGLRLASRGRERAWWLLALAVAAAVLVAVIAKAGGAPAWVQLVCIGVGTGLGLLVVELRARRAQDDKTATVVREAVASGSEQLPQMGSVGIEDLRVHRAVEAVDYVQREVEPEVERRLRTERRVLIVGPSMSGKTRLALQLTRRLYADHRLLVPKDGKALHGLLAAGVTGTGLVVWLDELERYLGTDGLTTDVLNRFHAQGNVLVATIRSAAYEALLPSGELRPAGWEVPGWFGDPVWLIRWTAADLDRAVASGISAKVLAGARLHGLSAYLGGGPLTLDRLHTAETTHPLGHALVRAAADWRRVGVSSPVPRPVLVALAPVYLDTGPGRPKVDQKAVRHGLEWATTLINDSVALLEQANGGYSVLDYALDFLSSQHPPIPAQAWDAALEHADPGDLVLVGYQAATEHVRFDVAESAWLRSAAHGDVYAMYNLGVLLDRRGQETEAEQWYRKAAELNDADAMYNLGVLLSARGDKAEAGQWYRKAAEVEYPDSST
jgi:tetratricopeptide (TPR) repeat protein